MGCWQDSLPSALLVALPIFSATRSRACRASNLASLPSATLLPLPLVCLQPAHGSCAKSSCDDMGLLWIIQGNLTILRSTWSITFIRPAEAFLLHHVISVIHRRDIGAEGMEAKLLPTTCCTDANLKSYSNSSGRRGWPPGPGWC